MPLTNAFSTLGFGLVVCVLRGGFPAPIVHHRMWLFFPCDFPFSELTPISFPIGVPALDQISHGPEDRVTGPSGYTLALKRYVTVPGFRF